MKRIFCVESVVFCVRFSLFAVVLIVVFSCKDLLLLIHCHSYVRNRGFECSSAIPRRFGTETQKTAVEGRGRTQGRANVYVAYQVDIVR